MNKLLALAFLVLALAACKEKAPNQAAPAPAGSASPAGAAGSAEAAAPAGSAASTGATAPAGSAAPIADAGVVFPRDLPKVGHKATKADDMNLVLKIGDVDTQIQKHTEDAREILEVDGEVFTKAKLTYVAHKKTQTTGGKSKEQPSPLTGKTYMVSRKDGAIEATHEDGSVVTEDELKALRDDNKRFGLPSVMDRILTTKTWKVGAQIAFSPDEIAEVNKQNEDRGGNERLVALAFTLTGVDTGIATLTMKMTMEMRTPQGSMDMSLDGAARIDVASGRMLEVGATGPVKGQMGGPVSGTMTRKSAWTY
jgi:hypothetical protein